MAPLRSPLKCCSNSSGGRASSAPVTRRQFTLSTFLVALPGLDLFSETAPQQGACPECIGVIDGTLGSCAGVAPCLSSYDDRPAHFVAPWEHEERSNGAAQKRLVALIRDVGGQVEQEQPGYVHAVFPSPTDDVEFLFTDGDTTVQLRSLARQRQLPDFGRNWQRLEALRTALGWQPVPIVRNRQRALVVVESPFDSFGPTPPSGELDYDSLLRQYYSEKKDPRGIPISDD